MAKGLGGLLVAGIGLAGLSGTPVTAAEPADSCVASAPPGLSQAWLALCAAEPEQLPLARMRAGQQAMEAGYLRAAAVQFEAALPAPDQASAARGAPHERMMAHHYRGILALLAGDWAVAERSFAAASREDTRADKPDGRSDAASQVWLAGWAARCQGDADRADSLFARAGELRPELEPPGEETSLLVVAESGKSPRQGTTGASNDLLVVKAANQVFDMVQAENLAVRMNSGRAQSVAEPAGGTDDGRTAADMISPKRVDLRYRADDPYPMTGSTSPLLNLLMVAAAVAHTVSPRQESEAAPKDWDGLPHSIHLAALPPVLDGLGEDALDLLDGTDTSVLRDRGRVRLASYPACQTVWIPAAAVSPSLLPAAEDDRVAEEPAGPVTCRAPSGRPAALPEGDCRRIGGQPLG